MDIIFFLLFLAIFIVLIWVLISPKSLSKRGKKEITRKNAAPTLVVFALVFLLLTGATAPKQPQPQTVQLQTTKSTQKVTKPTIAQKTVTQTKDIPFTSTTVQNSSLAKGTTKITTQGVDGVETLTYQDTYTNGKQTDQKLITDVITTKPVPQVTTVGTYVAPAASTPSSNDTGCTNGTYVNSAGNTVCSPETSSTVPAGATAQCVDGTYSFSQSRSGTCSHHGGVAQWLN